MASPLQPVPITILTGFLGAGKTTLLLSLIPQLPPNYRLCLLKNEFGDVAVDSQLAAQSSITGVKELLNGCICCNLVGQLSEALLALRDEYKPARIVIETSGSAFPATLAMEVNRIAREYPGAFVLDGVIQTIDAENWTGYDDKSYTAKLQARYTDLIVINKHELAGPQKEEEVIDRIRDLADDTPIVRSDKGWISKDVVFGLDSQLIKNAPVNAPKHDHNHSSEVDVLSITLPALQNDGGYVDTSALQSLLTTAPKDEVYRIKGIVRCRLPPPQHPDAPLSTEPSSPPTGSRWILNWAFGRWTFAPLRESSVSTVIEAPDSGKPIMNGNGEVEHHDHEHVVEEDEQDPDKLMLQFQSTTGRKGSIEVVVQTSIKTTVEEGAVGESEAVGKVTMIVARGEGARWLKKLEKGEWLKYDRPEANGGIRIEKIS